MSLPALSVATLKDIVVNRRLSSYGLAVRIAGQLPSLCPTVQFGVDFGSLLVELKRQVSLSVLGKARLDQPLSVCL